MTFRLLVRMLSRRNSETIQMLLTMTRTMILQLMFRMLSWENLKKFLS